MDILGIRIDKVNMNKAVEIAKTYLEEDKFHMIFTPNPEMIIIANKDEEFKRILNSSSLNIPDGNGVVWAAKQKKILSKRGLQGLTLYTGYLSWAKIKILIFIFWVLSQE